jgi:hypothetical protein
VGERARASGKTSLSRLPVEEAGEALGVEVDVLRKRIRANAIPHERDEHGQVWVLVGASSNVPDTEHNRRPSCTCPCRPPHHPTLPRRSRAISYRPSSGNVLHPPLRSR